MEAINNIAEKFLPVTDGVYFVLPVESLEMSKNGASVVRSNDQIFFKNGNTFASLNDEIMNHLDFVMKKNETIAIYFAYCKPQDYAIQNSFKITLNKTECASILGYYSAFRENLMQEKKVNKATS